MVEAKELRLSLISVSMPPPEYVDLDFFGRPSVHMPTSSPKVTLECAMPAGNNFPGFAPGVDLEVIVRPRRPAEPLTDTKQTPALPATPGDTW